MRCCVCNSENIEIIYDDYIRNGAVGNLTDKKYKMFHCKKCGMIWHENAAEEKKNYYETEQYRMNLEHTTDISDFYKIHDVDNLEKFEYTGTDIFRGKVVADIGCGGGSFLDFISGVASEIIAIEPSLVYRSELIKKGYRVYPYVSDAIKDGIQAEVITSFDVIEHVNSPYNFITDAYSLLDDGGLAITGTPTDAPLLRTFLGHDYEQFLFSYQHPWVISQKALEIMCKKIGFSDVKVEYKQRYGLTNAMMWLRDRRPSGHISSELISASIEEAFKRMCEENEIADYIVAYTIK